jgi:hypothetical protein
VRRINSAGGVSGLHLIASQSSHRSNNGPGHKQQCDELFAGAFAADGQLKIERCPITACDGAISPQGGRW